ncbi:S8 family peptidase [Eudoraea sp.]|uniref:S8 family peptidase n=1 Tax=Eudoraea sp. TaxID=1979955 RepID=UPI003C71FD16
MRKLSRITVLLIFLVLLNSCGTKTSNISIVEQPKDSTIQTKDEFEKVRHQIIVAFADTLSNDTKVSIRNEMATDYPFETSFESCSCGNTNVEKWTFMPSVDVESAVSSLNKKKKGGVEGENQFILRLPKAQNYKPPQAYEGYSIDSLTLEPNSQDLRVNIAVIDTGIDIYMNKGAEPFLYNTQDVFDCENEISGWNFVSGNWNTAADHQHGTYVTKTITYALDNLDVEYSILPIKAFDEHGVSTYWNLICAMGYVKELQDINEDIHLVNASFGYNFAGYSKAARDSLIIRQNILKGIIDDLEQSTIVVSSAGNEDLDNDDPRFAHFPSGFPSGNLLGVGGYIGDETNMQKDGNYGQISIDVAARYKQNFVFELTDVLGQQENLEVVAKGTSFSTAFTTAKLAKIIYDRLLEPPSDQQVTPAAILQEFYVQNYISQHTKLDTFIKNSNYIKDPD